MSINICNKLKFATEYAKRAVAFVADKFSIAARRFKWDETLSSKAIAGDVDSIKAMFQTFMGNQEQILDCSYLGIRGLWGLGHHCWAAVTDRRFATITLSPLRGVRYQDVFVDRVDRVQFHQPSGFAYIWFVIGGTISAIFGSGALGVISEEMDIGLLGPLEDIIESLDIGWSVLFLSLVLGVILVVAWYLSLALARRFIKRGIECRTRNACVDAFCDPAATPDGLRLMRRIAHMRDQRLKMVVGQ